jgi:Flp pilus assembly protein TadG
MMLRPRRILGDQIGAVAMEFALVAPTFLMFVFLILDGGRMLFFKQSLNEVAAATARCYAIQAQGCTSVTSTQGWAVARGLTRDNLKLSASDVVVTTTSCNGIANMARAQISATWQKGAMTLLPQSVAPSTLTSTACYPIAA